MGREHRSIDPRLLYHAGSRGSNRGPIVWDAQDYNSLAGELARAASRHRWRVLAWCVMPNHHHLVLRMPNGGFAAGFQQMNGNHSRRTNRRYGRDAHLFKNRPWSVELGSVAHVIGALAYVLRNPVSGELCRHAEEWPWSSYRATVGLEPAPSWLAVEEARELFGRTLEEVRHGLDGLIHLGQLLVSDTG